MAILREFICSRNAEVVSDFINGNKWMLHIKYDIVKLQRKVIERIKSA